MFLVGTLLEQATALMYMAYVLGVAIALLLPLMPTDDRLREAVLPLAGALFLIASLTFFVFNPPNGGLSGTDIAVFITGIGITLANCTHIFAVYFADQAFMRELGAS